MLPKVSGEFRVVNDPELRFAPSGVAVGKFRVAANSRRKADNGEWVDDKVCFLSVTVFKKLAENVAESLSKGDLVVIEGRLQTEEWEKDGEKRQAYVVVADFVGPSLAYKAARPIATERTTSAAAAPAEDPWGTPPSQGDEPPF